MSAIYPPKRLTETEKALKKAFPLQHRTIDLFIDSLCASAGEPSSSNTDDTPPTAHLWVSANMDLPNEIAKQAAKGLGACFERMKFPKNTSQPLEEGFLERISALVKDDPNHIFLVGPIDYASKTFLGNVLQMLQTGQLRRPLTGEYVPCRQPIFIFVTYCANTMCFDDPSNPSQKYMSIRLSQKGGLPRPFVSHFADNNAISVLDGLEMITQLQPDDPSADSAAKQSSQTAGTSDGFDAPAAIPLSFAKASQRAAMLEEGLKEAIYGQDAAIDRFVDAYKRYLVAPASRRGKPSVVCLLAGPPGTGKTYLAETAATILDANVKRFDMSAYAGDNSNTHEDLDGFAKAWKGAQPGFLTEAVRKSNAAGKPCVLIIDEIEKAGRFVQLLFLQILEGAHLKDKYHDRDVDFSNTIIFFTTNCGKAMYEDNETEDLSKLSTAEISEALSDDEDFPPELISRFSSGVMTVFNHLDPDALIGMTNNILSKSKETLQRSQHISLTYSTLLPRLLLLHQGKTDARVMSSTAAGFFTGHLFNVLADAPDHLSDVSVHFDVDPAGADQEIADMLKTESKSDFAKAFRGLCFKRKVLNFDTDYNGENGRQYEVRLSNLRLEKMAVNDAGLRRLAKKIGLSEFQVPDESLADLVVSNLAKEKVSQFINYCSNIDRYISEGADMPKGILLYGPPGTGKTSLARAVAGASDATFLNTSGAMILSAKNSVEMIEDIFRLARSNPPSIIFIDEFEDIGGERTTNYNPVINKLLKEMENKEAKDPYAPVYIIAATNAGITGNEYWLTSSERIIDPAICRRFDLAVEIGYPTAEERRIILEQMLKSRNKELSENGLDNIVTRTRRKSPADIERLIEAALYRSIDKNIPFSDDLVCGMLDELLYGEKHENIPEEDERITAYHETGHLILSYLLRGAVPAYITIEARGDHGGYVLPAEDTGHCDKESYLDEICSALGGRAAEDVFLGGKIYDGQGADLRRAHFLARTMVCRLGMGSRFYDANEMKYPGKAAQEEIQEILNAQMERAKKLLQEKEALAEHIVKWLLKDKAFYGNALEALLQGKDPDNAAGADPDAQHVSPVWYVVTTGAQPGVFETKAACLAANDADAKYFTFADRETAEAVYRSSMYVPKDLEHKKMLYHLMTLDEFRTFTAEGMMDCILTYHSETPEDIEKKQEASNADSPLVYICVRRTDVEDMQGARLHIGDEDYSYADGLPKIDWQKIALRDENDDELHRVRVHLPELTLEDCLSILTPNTAVRDQVAEILDELNLEHTPFINISSRYFTVG